MTDALLIVTARAAHILSSTVWAGFVIPVGLLFVGSGASRILRQAMVNRTAPVVAVAAVVSLISGIYLFVSLHKGGHGPAESALGIGAAAAVLSFLIGAFFDGPLEKTLARLDKEAATHGNASTEISQAVVSLEKRAVFFSRLIVVLLMVSVIAMAIARFL